HTRCYRDWSSDVCSSDLGADATGSPRDLPAQAVADRSLVGSDQPPLEQGDHAVNPWHQLRWSLLLPFEKSDLVLVALVLQGQVPQPAVGVDDAAGCDRILHKWNQAFGRSVQNLAHANS